MKRRLAELKVENPELDHRQAFKVAAQGWAAEKDKIAAAAE